MLNLCLAFFPLSPNAARKVTRARSQPKPQSQAVSLLSDSYVTSFVPSSEAPSVEYTAWPWYIRRAAILALGQMSYMGGPTEAVSPCKLNPAQVPPPVIGALIQFWTRDQSDSVRQAAIEAIATLQLQAHPRVASIVVQQRLTRAATALRLRATSPSPIPLDPDDSGKDGNGAGGGGCEDVQEELNEILRDVSALCLADSKTLEVSYCSRYM